jgi:hypothetical protein
VRAQADRGRYRPGRAPASIVARYSARRGSARAAAGATPCVGRTPADWRPTRVESRRAARHRAARAPIARSDPPAGPYAGSTSTGRSAVAHRSARPHDLPVVNKGNHHFPRRSSSAWAKYADIFREISLARLSSTCSRCRAVNCGVRRWSRRGAAPRHVLPVAPTAARLPSRIRAFPPPIASPPTATHARVVHQTDRAFT